MDTLIWSFDRLTAIQRLICIVEAEAMSPSALHRILNLSKDKQKGHPRMWCAPERVEWLPLVNALRNQFARPTK